MQRYDVPLPGGRVLRLGDRTLVMGILNVTPDSFSDGGRYLACEAAVAHGEVGHLEQRGVHGRAPRVNALRMSPVMPSGAKIAVTMSAMPLMANT